jgi:hypothetical protein
MAWLNWLILASSILAFVIGLNFKDIDFEDNKTHASRRCWTIMLTAFSWLIIIFVAMYKVSGLGVVL